MRVCLYEDDGAVDLEPVALTRPVFDLHCGLTTLGHKQRRLWGPASPGVLIRPYLAASYTLANPLVAVNDPDWLGAGPATLVNGRWLPSAKTLPGFDPLEPCVGIVGDEVAFVVPPPDELHGCNPENVSTRLAEWKERLPNRPAGGRVVRYPWDLVDSNGEEIAADFAAGRGPESAAGRPATLTLIGPSDWLRIDPTARIDPFVVADTNNGPVVIDRDAVVTSFTRLEGPCYVGRRSQVFSARIRAGTSVGPNCRVGGEVECSILHGCVNKYHDGFLGHSYVGEWVNLAAGTQTSDLRNDYAEVTVVLNGARVPTGRTKVGAFIGDHSRTGLGALLNTGTTVGVFGSLLPSGELLPRQVPSFCRVTGGRLAEEPGLEALFAAAERVSGRRGETFTAVHRELFRSIWERTAAARRATLREAEMQRLRRSAG